MPIIGGRGAGVRGLGFQGAAAPNQVTGLAATDFGTSRAYNDGRIDLSWTAPANNGATISGYLIERSTNGSSYSTLVANTGSSATTYSDTSLSSNQIYYYKVSAINAAGTGLASTAANATATTVPQAPTIGTPTCATGQAYTGSANISVPFTANATGGKSITSYTVTPSAGGGTGTGASSPITISRTVGTSYTFTVTATNANGTSSASAASASVLSASVPQAPTIGTATAGTESASVTFTGNATGGSAITTYTMTSSPGSVTGTGASSPITVSNLTAGTAYTFTVTATNAYGTSAASTASNSITPTAPFFAGIATSSTIPGEPRTGWDTTAIDSSGNMYVGGTDFKVVSGTNRRFGSIAKINPSGQIVWQKLITGDVYEGLPSYYNRVYRIAVSSGGNVYVTGGIKNSQSTGDALFLAKFDSSGNLSWYKRFVPTSGNTNGNSDNVNTVVIDSSENVYVSASGSVSGTGQFFCNIFKFNSSGTEQWKKQLQNNYADNSSKISAPAIAVDSSGNVFVGGTTNSSSYTYTAFALKLNSSGTEQWKRKISAPSGSASTRDDAIMNAAVIDSSGNPYFAGQFKNNAGFYDGYTFKYDTNGTIQWQRKIYNTGVAEGARTNGITNMGIDSSNNLYVIGSHKDSSGVRGGFVAKYNSSGTFSNSWNLRTTRNFNNYNTSFYGIGLDSSNNLYITGITYSNPSVTEYGIAFLKTKNDGTKTGTYTIVNGVGLVYGTTNPMTSEAGTATDGTQDILTINAGTTTAATTPALTINDGDLTWNKVNI